MRILQKRNDSDGSSFQPGPIIVMSQAGVDCKLSIADTKSVIECLKVIRVVLDNGEG